MDSNSRKPNLLLISIDSLRADVVSGIGSTDDTTPFLDQIIEESTVFTSAFSQGVWTVPSHTSIFTGTYPAEHGLYAEDAIANGEVALGKHPTIAQRLSDNGYMTRAFHRPTWLGYDGILRGFDQAEAETETETETETTVERLELLASKLPISRSVLRGIYRGTFRGHMPDSETVERAVGAINSCSSPFCFFIHFNDAHWPYSPSKPFYNKHSNRTFVSLFWNRAYTQTRMFSRDGDWKPSERGIETMYDLYLGGVSQVDFHLKNLVTSIPDDILEKTIIIIFGDHGEAFDEAHELGHNDIIPSVTHVPLIIRDPTGQMPADNVSKPVELMDIYQTVAELTDTSVPQTSSCSLISDISQSPAIVASESNSFSETLLGRYGAFRSRSEYVIWDAIEDKYYPRNEFPELKESIRTHVTGVNSIPTDQADAIEDDTRQRLIELGYFK